MSMMRAINDIKARRKVKNAQEEKQKAQQFEEFMNSPFYRELKKKLDETARFAGINEKHEDAVLVSNGERKLANELLNYFQRNEELVRKIQGE